MIGAPVLSRNKATSPWLISSHTSSPLMRAILVMRRQKSLSAGSWHSQSSDPSSQILVATIYFRLLAISNNIWTHFMKWMTKGSWFWPYRADKSICPRFMDSCQILENSLKRSNHSSWPRFRDSNLFSPLLRTISTTATRHCLQVYLTTLRPSFHRTSRRLE